LLVQNTAQGDETSEAWFFSDGIQPLLLPIPVNRDMLRNHPFGRWLRHIIPKRWRPVGMLTEMVTRRSGGRVLAGPFAGMAYIEEAFSSAHLPKLLGIYERELVGPIEKTCAQKPELIVDIGAAEGYYAVGFARRNLQARIVAFEMDEAARHALQRMARSNAVEGRVEVRGRCEPEDLRDLLASANDKAGIPNKVTLIICDAEGDERALLDPQKVPALCEAYIIVEVHDYLSSHVGELLEERFRSSHRIERILQQPRIASDFPFSTMLTRCLPRVCVEWAVSEWRPALMSWLWMEPR
jgi:hypothetical protein